MEPQFTFETQPVLISARMRLRNLETSDADSVTGFLSDRSIARMLVPVPQPYRRVDAESWISDWRNGRNQGWCFAITLNPEKGSLAGVISIQWKPDRGTGSWSFGYWLGRSHWGQGLMSEAASMVCNSFFEVNPDAVLPSSVIFDNPASLKIQQNLGFSITGSKDVWCVSRGEMVKLIETELTFGGFMPL